jgi:hypothetical protein
LFYLGIDLPSTLRDLPRGRHVASQRVDERYDGFSEAALRR